MKEQVREYWDREPCGTRGVLCAEGTIGYFDAIAANRRKIERSIPGFVAFEKWWGKEVLEIGCGVGTDSFEFARNGANLTAIDLSPKSVELTRKRLESYGLNGKVMEGDAEQMVFEDNTFDMVYSFGVLHHTPEPDRAIKEIHRVLKPDGEIRIMLYHKPSIVCLQMWLMFGLLKGKPFRGIDDILFYNHESVGTTAYTVNEARYLFSEFQGLDISTAVAAYDIRYARGRYLPMWFANLVPNKLGWYILLKGKK